MSTIDITTTAATEATVAEPGRLQRTWDWIEARLVRMGDRLNPILVKETRQAIKSRQFTVTFVLVLLACWVVTIGGVAMIGPGIFYSASGPDMFWYYYWILAFPLAVIVPYSAYRSLAAEREDNTYELLSISNLTPRQIIAGKLGSALLQMLVFLSATAPCLAFTYLLRGIDVLTIAVLLTYTVLGSLGLAVIGLFMATSAKERYGQVILSVALVVGQVVVFFMSIGGSYEFIRWSYQFVGDKWFWIGNLAALTAYVTTFALVFLAAAAQITFTSDNRSTPLRIAMIVQQACYIGWVWAMFLIGASEDAFGGNGNPPPAAVVIALSIPSGIYWYVMGTMLTAEWPHLSARVKRSLPQSFLGRTFFTWFNPGPGTGYMFVVSNLGAIALVSVLLLALLPASTMPGGPTEWETFCFVLIGVGYITAYLGLGKLIVDLLRRVAAVPMVASVLINGFLIAAGSGIPLVIHMMSNLRYSGYSLLHVTNPIWTLEQILFGGSAYTDELVVIIPFAGLAMFAVNLPAVIREIRQVRVAAPARIQEDDALLKPAPEPQRESPWDEPEIAVAREVVDPGL
jgi:hypothetical protein